MADAYFLSRSNYFRVKSPAKFRKFAKTYGLDLWQEDGTFGIGPIRPGHGPSTDGYFPSHHPVTNREINFPKQLSRHLKEGEIAILMIIGWEKLCWVTGWAIAINSNGDCIRTQLEDIYKKAGEEFRVPLKHIGAVEN